MSFTKIIGLGVLALGLAFATTGCGLFESDEPEMGFQPADSGAGTGNAAPTIGGTDLTGGNGTGPGGYGKEGESVVSPYGDFLTPDPNLHLAPVYFAFDQARIGASETSKVDAVANYLLQNPGTGVVIEGNCDERGSAEYNRALGERRAIAAKELLLSKGIAESRIKTVSFGVEKPADPGHAESAWSKNRRDEFIGGKLKHQ